MPATSTNWPDLLDPRFKQVFDEQYKQHPDAIAKLFKQESGDSFPTKDTARFSEGGTFGDVEEFTGSLKYDDVYQGYDTTFTHKEYAKGFSIAKTLWEDGQFGIMEGKPAEMAVAYARTRQKHAAQFWINSFSVDATWQSGGDGQALCSDSHTTTAPGISTSSGFDNKITAALSAVSVTAARIQMRKLRDDRGHPFEIDGTSLLYPVDLYETAEEITGSAGKLDTANNNINVHKGVMSSLMPGGWIRLTDANDWWLIDESYLKQFAYWIDRVQKELDKVEDFDTFVARWRMRARYSLGYRNWRFVLGAQVG